MLRQPQSPPLARRVDARRPISADLLAAAASAPLELAADHRAAWFDTAEELVTCGFVLVFDEFVVGLPDPLLLEAAHHLRLVRRAEALGVFDEEEEAWYEHHGEDDDAYYERPSLPLRVLVEMMNGQEAERLALGSGVAHSFWRACPPEAWFTSIRLGRTLERLVVELADAVRIGDAVPVDARLAGERAAGLRWVA